MYIQSATQAEFVGYLMVETNGLFGWRGEGGGVEGSKVEFAKNKLILC